jgi:peroxiredoxin
MLRFVLAAALAVIPFSALAGEFNKVLSVGDAAPEWTELPGTDGEQHSSADLDKEKFVVVVFTCNSCPVAVKYEDRLIEFAKAHEEDVSVVAVNVNRVEEDNLENMTARSKEKEFPFAYLFDESQKIAKDFGATGTPEVFLISPERKIVYMGAIDDEADVKKVKAHHLEDALAAAKSGSEPAVKETYPHGCRIRFARERKRQ